MATVSTVVWKRLLYTVLFKKTQNYRALNSLNLSIWLISALVLSALFLLACLLIYFLCKPIHQLNLWSRSLNREGLSQTVPDFGFKELNQLAEQVHHSLQDVDSTLRREARFLKYASHELRTPIAVIRSNVALLERLMAQVPDHCQQPLQRLSRAGLTMSHLTETLLWLNRQDDTVMLTVEPVQLNQLLESLVEDHRYLLEGKAVSVQLELPPIILQLPKTLIRIVLANIIRNAMQHTNKGKVQIQLTQQLVSVNNHGELLDADSTDGFGLGMELVKQICQRQGWRNRQYTESNAFFFEVKLGGKI